MAGEFSQHTKNTLAKRAGEKCTICKKNTSRAHSKHDKFVNLGEAAHINGRRKEQNNRFIDTLPPKQIKDIRNGIWLCPRCHKDIDSDEVKYPSDFLKDIRKQHENELTSGAYNIVPSQLTKEIEQLERLLKEKERSLNLSEKLFQKEVQEYKRELSSLTGLRDQEDRKFEQLLDEAYEVMKKSSFEDYKQITKLFFQRKFDEAEALLDEEKIVTEANKLKESLEHKSNLLIVKARIASAKNEPKKALRLFEKSISLHISFRNLLSYTPLNRAALL